MEHMQPGGNRVQYRLTSMQQQLDSMRQQIEGMQARFVLANVNEVQLQEIRNTEERAERDVHEIKTQFTSLNEKLINLEKQLITGLNAHTKALDDFKIKALWTAVSLIITFLTGLLLAYLTHFIH